MTGTTARNYAASSKGNHNGSVSNVTIGQSGRYGRSYSFDGNGDRVIVTTISPNATFSFVMAFKRNGVPDVNDRILDQAGSGPTRGWHIGLAADGTIQFRTWNNGGAQLSLDFGIVADGEWCIIGGSIGASGSKLYLNGVEVANGAGNSFGSGIVADLQLGARSGGVSNAMAGYLQHVAIGSNVEWNAAIHKELARFFF